jgi:hypothetical protein
MHIYTEEARLSCKSARFDISQAASSLAALTWQATFRTLFSLLVYLVLEKGKHTAKIMAGRQSGSKIVAVAVTATLAAVGVGCIYLPFIADKDRIRGLHEESDLSGSEKREYDRVMAQMKAEMGETPPAPQHPQRTSNSMWKRMNDRPK